MSDLHVFSKEQQNKEIVAKFLAHCEKFEFESAWEFVSDDFHYRNHPFPGTNTKETSLKQLKILVGSLDTFIIKIHQMAADGDTVLNERSDIFIGRFFHIDLPVYGVFKLRDGKIYEWRDNFDFLTLMIASLKSPFVVISKLFGKEV